MQVLLGADHSQLQSKTIERSSRRTVSFHLEKWYLDCITESGDGAICYSALLEWKHVSFSYASFLTFDKAGLRQKTSLLNEKQPEQTLAGLVWQSDGLHARGLWQAASEILGAMTLYQGEMGKVRWHCVQPVSSVDLTIGTSHYTGLGYAERLEMTVEPWKLPIDELRWGRFLSENAYMVWIQWRGPLPITMLFCNGELAERAEISTNGVCWDKGKLLISNTETLREGPIISTALANIPLLGSLLPGSFHKAYECKWQGFGELRQGNEVHTGWVIHEIVQFQ